MSPVCDETQDPFVCLDRHGADPCASATIQDAHAAGQASSKLIVIQCNSVIDASLPREIDSVGKIGTIRAGTLMVLV